MAHERAIAQALDSLWNKSSERNLIRGRLGLPGGGSPVFDVPDRPGYKYVNKGAAGELGQVIARDPIGVANTYNQTVWMRYEFGEYVIQRAESVTGGGGGGGASNLDALTDVTLTAPANGNTLQYNSSTGQWVNVVPAGGAGGAPSPHPLGIAGGHHTPGMLLPWTDLNKSGSSLNEITTRPHSMLTGIGPDDHHAQAHVLASGTALGADHTISGAAAGEVLRALGPTTAAFDVLQHTDLGNILPDQHHAQVHNIVGTDHTITGSQFQVVGATNTNVLGLLTPTPTPGAAAAILRTDANGGIQLDTNLLYVDGANNWIGVNRTPSGATLDLIAFSNADHTQRIKMKSGQTARLWRIEDLSGNELIVLDSVGNLQSGRPGFVSGLTGWQITPQGNAEFNNIWARGELHATVFVKDEIHATGGTFMVATAGTLYDDAVISSSTIDDDTLVVYSTPAGQGVPLQVVTTSGTFVGTELHVSWIGNFINVNDPPSGPGFYFQPGDIVRSKTEVATGVTDFWFEVLSATQNSGYATYSVYKRSGTDGTLPKGAALVSYGKQGDGRILMTSDLNYAPYIDVFTVGPNVWTGGAGSVIPRMRMGRLDGIGLPGVSGIEQYGMIAGKDLSDANSGYLIASNLQFSLYKVDIRLNNGTSDTGLWTADGNLKIGSNVGATATTGFSVFTTGGRAGDVVIGNEATGNYLRWQQATGILTVTGSLIVSDPGTTVTKTYVDNQDAAYDAKADLSSTGYAGIAQANSTAYGDARRIVGVTGTWPSAANQISWSGLAVTFANGSTRSIANGNTGTMAARTYLYVNMSGTGAMTMVATTSASAVGGNVNNVLIAVCDPGPAKASVSVVAGSTYISGSNIFTESIFAGHIAALTITGAQIAGNTITADKLIAGSITVTYLDPTYTSGVNSGISTAQSTATTANTAAGTAQTTANTAQTTANTAQTTANNAATAAADNLTYTESHRIMTVGGVWDSTGINQISWSGVVVGFGDGNSATVTDGSFTNITGRRYIYIDLNSTPPYTLFHTNLVSNFGPTHAVLAVADPGTTLASGGSGKATITVVAGSTYISGDNIMTGSIVANNIASRTIVAGNINVNRLDGLATGTVFTGTLEIDNTSNIHSAGKTAYNNSTAGIFLGWDTTATATYRFGIGDSTNYLQWTGSNLNLRMAQGIDILSTSSNIIRITNAANTDIARIFFFGSQFQFDHDLLVPSVGFVNPSGGALEISGSDIPGSLFASGPFVVNGMLTASQTVRIQNQRPIAGSSSAGNAGDMCWSYDVTNLYLYLCYGTNQWRRIAFPSTPW